jgi:hypothetical protein
MASDPLKFQADVYGNEAGIGWSQRQSGLVSGQQTNQATTQNTIDTMGILAKLFEK